MDTNPSGAQRSLADELINAKLAMAAKPKLLRACAYFDWQPRTDDETWAAGVASGLARRIYDQSLESSGTAGDQLTGASMMAADISLICLCDALSQQSGVDFDFVTRLAFLPNSDGIQMTGIDTAVHRWQRRLDAASIVYDALLAKPNNTPLFHSTGTMAMMFINEPSQRSFMALDHSLKRLQNCAYKTMMPNVDVPEVVAGNERKLRPYIVALIGIALGVFLTWRFALFLWASTIVLAAMGAMGAMSSRRSTVIGSVVFAFAVWSTFGAALSLLLEYLM